MIRRSKQRNEKRLLIPLGLRVPIWKIKFCFQYYLCNTAMCFCKWLGRLKCHMTGLEASLSLISTEMGKKQ